MAPTIDRDEFPTRTPKDANEKVVVMDLDYPTSSDPPVKDFDGNLLGCLELDRFCGYDYEKLKIVRLTFDNDFLSRFGFIFDVSKFAHCPFSRDIYRGPPPSQLIGVIKFKTLLAGYQIFKRDFNQFKKVLATAKDEEEFCILAGVS